MQAASEIMFGWYRVSGIDDLQRDFYFRQLCDANGSAIIEAMKPREVCAYAEIRGRTRARAHARSGDAVTISAYLGSATQGTGRWPTAPSSPPTRAGSITPR